MIGAVIRSLVCALACLCAWTATGAESPQNTQDADAALQHAQELLQATPLIDGHNDLPWLIREETAGDVVAMRLEQRSQAETNIPKLREGMVGAQFWSVWIPGETSTSDAGRLQLEQIDIARLFASGKIASLLGMEGGYALSNSLGAMRAFYSLGVRYMTLTHNVSVDWADAALGEQRHGGLTEFGRAMIQEMNRTGMMVDIAHTSPATMHDTLDVTKAPVIWSHAAAYAIVNHPRNVPDDVLTRLPDSGGVVMVTFIPSFLSKEVWEMEEGLWATDAAIDTVRAYRDIWNAHDAEFGAVRATIVQVADHIEHVRDVAGINHVGIGGDYWGMQDGPLGLEDVSGYPRLFAELIRRGWSDENLRKLAGENMLRVMREVEAVARRLRREMPASNVTISDFDSTT